MKSLRDLVNKMPESKEDLENIVRKYSPNIDEAIKSNPEYKKVLDDLVDDSFDRYSKYIDGKMGKATRAISAAGHAVGYASDAWLATGDIVGSLGGKFLNFLAQIPEKSYSIAYAIKTGNYIDSLQNILEGVVSYLPGLTIADEGLSRIIQKRMIKDVTYKMEKKLGKYQVWHERTAEKNKDHYTDVKDRKDNVIRVNFGDEEELEQAA